ncbi:unnamed protein product [Allacma fusca]|uniref:CRAL-TRIO domain-containing protein n=1 Tax=Allacma fusca TaxID=39272 RepID=A0A8J2JUG2_9HEXA|nr:unnamed protein product [Allacma fusca]
MLWIHLVIFALLTIVSASHDSIVDGTQNVTKHSNDILNWEVPENIKSKFPFYITGYDFENRPVIVFEWGKWYTRSVVEKNGQELVDLKKMQDLVVERLRTSFYRRPLNDTESGLVDDEFVLLVDMKAYNLLQLTSLQNLKYLMEYFAKFDKCYEKFAYGFMINVSAVAKQFVGLYTAFMAKYIVRTEVFGTDSKVWIPQLLRKIPPDQLPPKYGGTSTLKQ